MLLENKVAIVTGGTRGIGYAIVREYLKQGATVVLCGSRQETADKAVAQLKAENAAWPVEGISPDLTNYNSVKEAFDKVAEKYGKIDILANNAGVSASEPLTSYTPEMFEKTMNVNVNAVFNCTRAVVDYMKAQNSGCIINTAGQVTSEPNRISIAVNNAYILYKMSDAYHVKKYSRAQFGERLVRELLGLEDSSPAH